MNDPIAIVGMACRLPGGADDPETFWELLADGRDAIREIDRDGLDLGRFFDPEPRTPGRMMTRWGGFLDGLEEFDAAFFGISPREAATLDPTQRLLLETTWEACEDATIDPHTLAGGPVGVFVGQWLNDFESRLFADTDQVEFYATTGSGRYASSGRLSFVLGTIGPSMTVDTACSSSLVAVHLACQSLRSGESTVAIAGGVNVILQPHISIAYSQSGMMAPDGHCKFGDANGDGYVRSEGAAIVVLKPLAAALAAGDPIRAAVIRGSAVNNDGRGSGHMTTPSRTGQAAMLRAAYANAEVAPGDVGYVEAHGTGTRAGDPVELGALADVLGVDRDPETRLRVGSVKTNIGHTEGAAGLAGLLKCVLALEHEEIPASLHLDEPNPAIPWDAMPLDIPQAPVSWPAGNGHARLAGVSAFGITGTNAHVVLEEAPTAGPVTSPWRGGALPLVLSAASPDALQALADRYAELLGGSVGPELADVCATAACHRAALEHRAVFVGGDRAELVERLRRFAGGEPQAADAVADAPVAAPRRIAFVFPGQGGQWHGMARELLASEPVFTSTIDACDAALPPATTWTLRGQLDAEPGDGTYRLDEISVIQPTLLAVEIALAATWRAWGVEPAAVVGHSMGEVGAAYFAGALTIEDAMRVICLRSELLQRTSGNGAMALLDLTIAEATERVAPYDGRVVVAVNNGPRSTVVSGDPADVAAVLAGCERDGVFGRAVKVDVASHSAQMDPLVPELVGALDGLTPQPTTTPLYSSVEAAQRAGEAWNADYWGRNLRQPVLFGQTTEQLLADGIDAVIEVGPHPTLLPSLAKAAAGAQSLLTIGSLRRDEPERAALLAALGALWCAGHPVDWTRHFIAGSYQRVRLPHYPWQRQRHWAETAEAVAGAGRARRPKLDDTMRAWLHVPRWDRLVEPEPTGVAGRWLVVGGEPADAHAVSAALEAFGCTVDLEASAASAADRLGVGNGDAGTAARSILFLPEPGMRAFATIGALQTLQRAVAGTATSPPRLWWITRGAQVLPGDVPVESAEEIAEKASIWGAARVIAAEHPDWWGGLVDLDPATPVSHQADQLARQLLSTSGEDQTAVRSGSVWGLRIVAEPSLASAAPFEWRADTAYLITGGLGGVAEHIAMGMVGDGARRLVLLGRTGLPPRSEWAAQPADTEIGRRVAMVRALEHAGASVHVVKADIADEAQVRAALHAYAADGWPPIAGVIHAAAVVDSGLTSNLDEDAFDRAMTPKLGGAYVLDRVLPELDLFVVFSSILAYFAPPGTANYTAANAGLDALVLARRARGQHAMSIQWGPWSDVGLLHEQGRAGWAATEFEREGITEFSPEQGVACFNALTGAVAPIVSVLPIDWSKFRRAHRGRDVALFRAAPEEDDDSEPSSDVAQRIRATSGAERLAVIERVARANLGGVLRLPPATVDSRQPFGSLGLDSLMALELRNRLEIALERSLPASLAWNYPTIEALTRHLDALFDAASPSPTEESAPSEVTIDSIDVSDLLAGVAGLSDDDAVRALRGDR